MGSGSSAQKESKETENRSGTKDELTSSPSVMFVGGPRRSLKTSSSSTLKLPVAPGAISNDSKRISINIIQGTKEELEEDDREMEALLRQHDQIHGNTSPPPVPNYWTYNVDVEGKGESPVPFEKKPLHPSISGEKQKSDSNYWSYDIVDGKVITAATKPSDPKSVHPTLSTEKSAQSNGNYWSYDIVDGKVIAGAPPKGSTSPAPQPKAVHPTLSVDKKTPAPQNNGNYWSYDIVDGKITTAPPKGSTSPASNSDNPAKKGLHPVLSSEKKPAPQNNGNYWSYDIVDGQITKAEKKEDPKKVQPTISTDKKAPQNNTNWSFAMVDGRLEPSKTLASPKSPKDESPKSLHPTLSTDKKAPQNNGNYWSYDIVDGKVASSPSQINPEKVLHPSLSFEKDKPPAPQQSNGNYWSYDIDTMTKVTNAPVKQSTSAPIKLQNTAGLPPAPIFPSIAIPLRNSTDSNVTKQKPKEAPSQYWSFDIANYQQPAK